MREHSTLVVIGGGAAGVFCAVNAARLSPALKVILLEKTGKLLSKVKISGGGRCNVTHDCPDPDLFSSRYPRGSRFVRKAFYQFSSIDTIHWFQERGVLLKTEADGRMFPVTNNSQTIIDCLLKEMNRYGVECRLSCGVTTLLRDHHSWKLDLSDGSSLSADFVCIAAGGGNKESFYDWLKQTGHNIIPPVPSLFTFQLPNHPITRLAGVSVPQASVKIQGEKFKESGPILITHWGLSGPSILRLSAQAARFLHAVNYTCTIVVNWLATAKDEEVSAVFQQIRREAGARQVGSSNPFSLPSRLWLLFLELAGLEINKRWADVKASELQLLTRLLISHELQIRGKTTFKEEFVTAGGVDLKEIHPATMESKLHPNLFFAGEVMDVDALTGGFNFQHAWTSGFTASKTIAERIQSNKSTDE